MPMTNAEKQKKYRENKKKEAKAKLWGDLLKLSIVEFFQRVTKLIPTEKQKKLLLALEDEGITSILIAAGRQTGKSLCCAVAVIYLTLKKALKLCLVSAKDNYVYYHITNIFANNPELTAYVSWQGTKNIIPKDGYSLTNGSQVLLLTSSEKGVRGAGGSILFLDEAELMEEQTIVSAYGNTSGEKIKTVILGTLSSKYSKFNDMVKNPSKYDFTLFTWSEEECDWHTQGELDSKKKRMTEDEYNREVKGLFSQTDVKLLWDVEDINNCIKETVLPEGKPRESGVDGGGTGDRDKLSLTIIERIGKFKLKVLLSKVWDSETPSDKAAKEIGLFLREYKVQLCKVDSLPVDWTERIKEVFDKSRVFSVNFRYYKEEMQGQLTHILEGQGLEIPVKFEDLIGEMKGYKKQGRPHYDDRVDSLLLAAYSNEVLFPVKAPTAGRITICDMNKRTQWSNFGNSRSVPLTNTAYPNNRNFVPTLPNKNRNPIYGK